MSEIKILITLISFLGVLVVLGVNAGQDLAISKGLTNQPNVNLTFLNATTGIAEIQPPICNFDAGAIPIIGGLIWGADCVAKYVGFMLGLMTLTFVDIWILGLILGGVFVALGYVVMRLIRGGG